MLGVVNVSDCTFGGTIGQQYTMTANSPGLTSATSTPFASNTAAGTEAGVLITAAPNSVPASNVTNSQLNFQVVDAWGNPTVSNGDTILTVSSTFDGRLLRCRSRRRRSARYLDDSEYPLGRSDGH